MTSALLALAASVSWGVADYLGGHFSRRLSPFAVLLVVDVVAVVPILPFALTHGTDGLTWKIAALGTAGAIAGGTGLLAFYRGMQIGAISIVAPITGLSATIPIVVGLATGDHPSHWQELGFALALVGVVLAAREQHPETGKVRIASGVGLALVALVCFGGYFVPIHAGSQEDAFWTLAIFRVAAAAFALGDRRREPARRCACRARGSGSSASRPSSTSAGASATRSPRATGCSRSSRCSARSTR